MFKWVFSLFENRKDDSKLAVECDFFSRTVKVADDKELKKFMIEQIQERDRILADVEYIKRPVLGVYSAEDSSLYSKPEEIQEVIKWVKCKSKTNKS